MDLTIEERARELARYIIENKATVRAAAASFGVGKSTVHKDVAVRLRRFDAELWQKACGVLALNKSERHLRGGEATRRKYKNSR